jgi:hypothetical protein
MTDVTEREMLRMVILAEVAVELPGIEPELLQGKMHSELLFRSVWFRFSPARYLPFRFRVLTASMLTTYCPDSSGSQGSSDSQGSSGSSGSSGS